MPKTAIEVASYADPRVGDGAMRSRSPDLRQRDLMVRLLRDGEAHSQLIAQLEESLGPILGDGAQMLGLTERTAISENRSLLLGAFGGVGPYDEDWDRPTWLFYDLLKRGVIHQVFGFHALNEFAMRAPLGQPTLIVFMGYETIGQRPDGTPKKVKQVGFLRFAMGQNPTSSARIAIESAQGGKAPDPTVAYDAQGKGKQTQ